MGTVEQLEAKLWPYKMALMEVFGLDPEQTSTQISVGRESVTFTSFAPVQEITARLLADEVKLSGELSSDDSHTTVEIMNAGWNEAQIRAVRDYLEQFPGQS